MVADHWPLGHLPGTGGSVVKQKVTVPFLSDINSPDFVRVTVFVCPGATLPPGLVHSVVTVAVVLKTTVTIWLLPSPASLAQKESVFPLSEILGLPMK